MSKKIVLSIAFTIALAVCSVVLLQSGIVSANTAQVVQSTPTPAPITNDDAGLPTPPGPGYAVGLPAIKHVGSGTTPTSNEVKKFVLGHKFPLDATATGKPTAILDIEFITANAASAKMQGESVGLPATAMVIYVKVHGPFVFSAMSLPPGTKSGPIHTQDAVEVFDAATGNILLAGAA